MVLRVLGVAVVVTIIRRHNLVKRTELTQKFEKQMRLVLFKVAANGLNSVQCYTEQKLKTNISLDITN